MQTEAAATLASDEQEPTLVSLFSGAGGMDIGLEQAGWRTVTATDIDKPCMATLRESKAADIPIPGAPGRTYLSEARLLEADARELSAADLRPDGASSEWRPTLLAGGPPCQPWSSAGLQKGLADERGLLINHMVRLAGELRPRMILFENVRGFLTAIGPNGRPGGMLEMLKGAFEDLGYATTFATLNSADYGAAQRRVRFYMMATERHALPSFPTPTHARSRDQLAIDGLKPWVALGELLEGLPSPQPDEIVRPATEQRARELAELLPGTGIKTGGRVENNRPGGHWGYRQDGFLADPQLPSRTIRAASTPDWIRLPDGTHRRLTWRECAALQGFPAAWQFQGRPTTVFRQIGNAVQADTVEVLGHALMSSLVGGRRSRKPRSAPLPDEFYRRIKYTEAEHKTNGEHRVRVRAAVA